MVNCYPGLPYIPIALADRAVLSTSSLSSTVFIELHKFTVHIFSFEAYSSSLKSAGTW